MVSSSYRILVVDEDGGRFEWIKGELQPASQFLLRWRQSCLLEEVQDEEFEQTDVVITDSDKQESSSLARAIQTVRTRFPSLQFLVLGSSGDDGDQALMMLLESGAKGYLDLNTSADQLAAAVQALVAGGAWLPSHVLARYMDLISMVDSLPWSKMADDPWALFTLREQRVMLLMACGRSDRDIARTLAVDDSIVSACLHQLMHRTGAVNRPTLIALYLYHKLFRSEVPTTLDQQSVN